MLGCLIRFEACILVLACCFQLYEWVKEARSFASHNGSEINAQKSLSIVAPEQEKPLMQDFVSTTDLSIRANQHNTKPYSWRVVLLLI